MSIQNRYKLNLPVNGAGAVVDAAATNDANAATGIAAGGGYFGAVTAAAADGTFTAAAAGVGVVPLFNLTGNVIVGTNSTVCNYHYIKIGTAWTIGGQPHVICIDQEQLHVNQFEQVLDVKCNTLVDANGDIFPIAAAITWVYRAGTQKLFISIPAAAAAAFVNKTLIVSVISGRVS